MGPRSTDAAQPPEMHALPRLPAPKFLAHIHCYPENVCSYLFRQAASYELESEARQGGEVR